MKLTKLFMSYCSVWKSCICAENIRVGALSKLDERLLIYLWRSFKFSILLFQNDCKVATELYGTVFSKEGIWFAKTKHIKYPNVQSKEWICILSILESNVMIIKRKGGFSNNPDDKCTRNVFNYC